MWDYVAFFGYNFIFFLFALFVWYAFPKPAPYDYTTIPGLKRDPNSTDENGNLEEMRASGDLQSFLEQLHGDYGPLASFYWGTRYVVAVGGYRLWTDVMLKWTKKIGVQIDIGPFEVVNKNGGGRREASPADEEAYYNNSILLLEKLKSKLADGVDNDDDDFLQNLMKVVIDNHEQALVRMPYDEACSKMTEFVDELVEDGGTKVDLRSALIYRATRRCSHILAANRPPAANPPIVGQQQSFSDLPQDSPWRNIVLECIRLAVPFAYVFCTFTTGEIDLDGHPIPAGVPIVLNVSDLCKHPAEDVERFIPERFLHKSNIPIGECLQKLPYFNSLAGFLMRELRQ